MPSPFPGMDPYLEDPEIWRGFHHSFADDLKRELNPLIGPKYYADVEVRTVVEQVNVSLASMVSDAAVLEKTGAVLASEPGRAALAIPKAPIQRTVSVPDRLKLRSVRIYQVESGQLVTSIEILSPFNKRTGEGIDSYRQKRARLLQSPAHLIELDLLRGGERPGRELIDPPLETDYIIVVNRATDLDIRTSEIWPVALNEILPMVPIPLLSPDPEIPLDLGMVFKNVYSSSGYDWRINYRKPVPTPPLRPAMSAWIEEKLRDVAKEPPRESAEENED